MRIKQLLEKFWAAIDTETVVMFQKMFYLIFAFTGFYGLYFTLNPPEVHTDQTLGVPQAIQDTMSPTYYILWLLLNIFGPLMVLVGRKLTGPRAYSGFILQFAGDIGVFFALGTYIAAVLDTSVFGRGLYAVFIVFACWLSTILFIARDVRRITKIEVVAQIERDFNRKRG